jgi:hypothetical protein
MSRYSATRFALNIRPLAPINAIYAVNKYVQTCAVIDFAAVLIQAFARQRQIGGPVIAYWPASSAKVFTTAKPGGPAGPTGNSAPDGPLSFMKLKAKPAFVPCGSRIQILNKAAEGLDGRHTLLRPWDGSSPRRIQ